MAAISLVYTEKEKGAVDRLKLCTIISAVLFTAHPGCSSENQNSTPDTTLGNNGIVPSGAGNTAGENGGTVGRSSDVSGGGGGFIEANGGVADGSGGFSNTGGTTSPTTCGDGRIDASESCEPGLEISETCEGLGKGIGRLTCDNACRFDTSGCITNPAELFTVSSEISSTIKTVGIVTWSISVPISEACIEFGLDTNYGMQAPVDLAEPQYRTLLLGMKGEREYHFRIVAKDQDTEYKSTDYTLTTGPATNLVRVNTMNVLNESARAGGFIVTSMWQGRGAAGITAGVPFVIDVDGDIVWAWSSPNLGSVSRARMSYDGKNMWMVGVETSGVERVSMDGLDTQFYPTVATHDITAVTGDVMAIVAAEWFTCGALKEITPDGNIKLVFDTAPLFVTNCHGNAVRYSEKEGYYTWSDMNQPNLLTIDRATGTLVHSLAEYGSFWYTQQHGHHLLDDGILVFTNVDSVAHEYAIDHNTKQLAERWRYQGGLISTFMGDVQRLPNGNTLVTLSVPAQIHEVDTNSNLVVSMLVSSSVGYSVWRKSLYGPPPDITL